VLCERCAAKGESPVEFKTPFATVEEALEEIRQGRMIVLVGDEDREPL